MTTQHRGIDLTFKEITESYNLCSQDLKVIDSYPGCQNLVYNLTAQEIKEAIKYKEEGLISDITYFGFLIQSIILKILSWHDSGDPI